MIVISLTLKVKMEMMQVNMFEPGSDSDDSDNLERAIEQEDNSLDQSSEGEGQARRNETTTSTKGRLTGRSRGRPRGGRVSGTTTRRVRSRSPVLMQKFQL